MNWLYLSAPVFPCYEGDPAGDPPADDQQQEEKKFTQADLNKVLAEDKRKHQAQLAKIEKQYQDLLKSTQLTSEQRVQLEESLENVQKQLRTKEEQAKLEKKALENQYQTQLNELQTKYTTLSRTYEDTLISREISDAASGEDAFNPNQVVALLRPLTKLVDGKPMIDFPDKSADTGEALVKQMTPKEAIKRMKELPESWGNLFKSNIVSGIGGSSSTGGTTGGGKVDVRKLTPEQYMKLRKENPSALGLK